MRGAKRESRLLCNQSRKFRIQAVEGYVVRQEARRGYHLLRGETEGYRSNELDAGWVAAGYEVGRVKRVWLDQDVIARAKGEWG